MNVVAKSDYNFHGVELVPTRDMHGVWFTSSNIASALKYANSRAVTMIYNKYSDEFSAGMTQVLEVSTSGNIIKSASFLTTRCPPNRDVCSHSGSQRVPPLGAGYFGSAGRMLTDCKTVY